MHLQRVVIVLGKIIVFCDICDNVCTVVVDYAAVFRSLDIQSLHRHHECVFRISIGNIIGMVGERLCVGGRVLSYGLLFQFEHLPADSQRFMVVSQLEVDGGKVG